MKNKILSIIIVLALVFSLSIPAFAAGFSDINGHWSQSYMEDLADKGYLYGYEDGKMRPNNHISTCETLVLLSRFYEPEEEESVLMHEDYDVFVSETVAPALSWAYDELVICLAAGIVTKTELSGMDPTAPIDKEQLALFLIRAMQLQDEAEELSNAELNFTDADEISDSCRGSVAELVSIGIVIGNDKHEFSPKDSVVRGIVAAMVSRALSYLRKSDTTLEVKPYVGFSRTDGIITAVSRTRIAVRGLDGLTRTYSYASSLSLTVNGTETTLSIAYIGCYAEVTAKDGEITAIEITSDDDFEWIQGLVNSVSSSAASRYLSVTATGATVTAIYTVADDAEITLDGRTVSLSAIEAGDFVTMKIEGGEVTELIATTSDCEITGEISSISSVTTDSIEVTDDAGTVYCFDMDDSAPPAINRGTTDIMFEQLMVGEEVTITVKACAVTSIAALSLGNTITGTVTSIISSTNGTQWVIAAAAGTETTLSIGDSPLVYSGTTVIPLSDIEVGDTVTVVIYGSTVSEICLISAVSSSDKITGTVLATDSSDKTVTILTAAQKLVIIDVSSTVSTISANTGEAISIYSVDDGTSLTAYGSYTAAKKFSARLIIIED